MSFVNQQGVLLGPLTTTWTMPETCTIFIPMCSTCGAAFRAQSCNAADGGVPRDHTACWPPVKSAIPSPAWPFFGWGFYSPGLACPSGYTSACTAVYGQRPEPPNWDTQFRLLEGETAVGCCPTGFSCTNINGNTCIVAASTATVIPTAYCDGTEITDSTTHTVPDIITKTVSGTVGAAASVTVVTRTMNLFAPMFQLNFRASDLSAEPTMTTDPSRTDETVAQTAIPEDEGRNGLSAGAKAGIGVGVGLGGLLLIGAVALLLLRRRKGRVISSSSRVPCSAELGELPMNAWKKPAASDVNVVTQPYEMLGYVPLELPAEELRRAK